MARAKWAQPQSWEDAYAVLHTWSSAMTHHPHVHMIVPGGGLSPDRTAWIATKPNFFLPVLVLSKLFRRLMLEKLAAAHAAGRLAFFGTLAPLTEPSRFAEQLATLRKKRWFVYSKRPFDGPKAVLAYLARYTHRVAISNGRFISADAKSVTFRVKNYHVDGEARHTTMTLHTAEFIRRFLLHVLPKGFHLIRHYGLLASAKRADNIELARELLGTGKVEGEPPASGDAAADLPPWPCCGSRQRIIEVFHRGETPKHRPTSRPLAFRIDTS